MLGLLFTSLGITRYGATRWLNLFIVTFQPAELAKLAFVFYMAKFLEFRLDHHGKFYRGYARIILIYVLIGALFLKQPDVGSTIILAALLASMLFIAGTRIKYFAVLISLVIAVISFVILFSPERLGRLIGWIDPWGTKGGEGYQIVNSQISIGSGGLFGAGLGSGHQNIGGFLPEAHTDFIFAVIGEELGFVGITVLIILYGIIIVRGIQIALRIKDDFKRFLTFGLVMLIAFPCVVHPCVNLGIFPTKGLCLPMVSFGGSSIFVCGLIIGLLLKLGSNSCIDEEKRKVTV
jgi:cell division protein FtsW